MPPIKELHDSIFPKMLIQLATHNDYSFKSCHWHLFHPYSLPRMNSTAPLLRFPPHSGNGNPRTRQRNLYNFRDAWLRGDPKNFLKCTDHQQLLLLRFPPHSGDRDSRSQQMRPKNLLPTTTKTHRSKDPKFLFFLSHLPLPTPLFYSLKSVYRKNNKQLLRVICGSPVERKAQWWGPQGIDCINS